MYLGILSAGLDSDANRIANANRLPLGTRVYAYAALRALAAWKPAHWRSPSTVSSASSTGTRVAVANSGVFGSGMCLVPDARARRRHARRRARRGRPQAPLPRQPAKVFKGTHVDEPGLHSCAGAASPSSADRPFTAYADGDPIAELPATVDVVPGTLRVLAPVTVRLAAGLAAARAVGGLARADRPRRRHLAARARCSRAWSRTRSSGSPARLSRGSVVISATNGKTTTAAMVSAVLERAGARLVHNRAGANMVGGVASALAAAARRGGRELDGDLGLFEVDEFWLGPVVEELEPRAILLSNLFRDQLDRYGELDTIADRWAELVAARAGPLGARAQRRRPAGRRPRPGRAGALYFGVEDDTLALPELQHASDSKHCRRCGHAYVYETVYLAHLGRYHCPNCGQTRPEPAVVARDVELRGIRSAAFTLAHGDEEHAGRAPAPGPLQRLQRARRRGAVPRARRPAGRRRRRPGRRRPRLRARGDDRPRRPPDLDPARQEPRRRQRGAAHAHARGRELDIFGVLNDRTADGRDVSWVWDADWRCSPRTCAG